MSLVHIQQASKNAISDLDILINMLRDKLEKYKLEDNNQNNPDNKKLNICLFNKIKNTNYQDKQLGINTFKYFCCTDNTDIDYIRPGAHYWEHNKNIYTYKGRLDLILEAGQEERRDIKGNIFNNKYKIFTLKHSISYRGLMSGEIAKIRPGGHNKNKKGQECGMANYARDAAYWSGICKEKNSFTRGIWIGYN